MAELINCLMKGGTFEQVKSIVDSGADVNFEDSRGMSALHWCAMYSQKKQEETAFQIVRLLIDQGADVNNKDHYGKTPIMYFIDGECGTALILLLLDNGADVTYRNAQGRTLLHNYSKIPKKSIEVFRRLVDGLLDINIRDREGETVLMNFLRHGCDIEYIELLLDAGSLITFKSVFGNTVLHYYAMWSYEHYSQENKLQILTRLFGEGTLANAKSTDGVTPLMRFGFYNLPKIELQFLLDRGADINVCDECGNSILHHVFLDFSQCNNYMDVVQMLLECGANPNIINNSGETPLSRVIHTGESDYCNLLFNYGLSRLPRHCDDIATYLIRNVMNLRYMKQKSMYRVVFKHMLLESESALDNHVPMADPHYSKLKQYVLSLVEELGRMKRRDIEVAKRTLFDFVAEQDRRKYSWYWKTSPVNFKIFKTEFPEYWDVIKSKIQISTRLSPTLYRIRCITISSRPESGQEKEVKLNLDCSRHILQFVTDHDLKNLLLALENSN